MTSGTHSFDFVYGASMQNGNVHACCDWWRSQVSLIIIIYKTSCRCRLISQTDESVDLYFWPILLLLSLWRCSALSGHTVVACWHGLGCLWVCVCAASIPLGRRVAPCRDCVYSFVTLWAALPSSHNWHCHQMKRDEGEETDRGQEPSQLISRSLCPSVSCYWSKEDIVEVHV